MDFFSGKLESIKKFIFKETIETSAPREISRFELYSEFVYHVLAWKDIALTLKVFLGINLLFWIFVEWGIKIYGIMFTSFLALFLWDSYFQSKNPDGVTSPYSDGFNDFCTTLSDIVLNLMEYRKENRFSFCFSSSIVFFIVYVLSKSIPDHVLIYLIILAIFFMPLALQCLPEETANTIRQCVIKLGSQTAVLAEEELMPFISNKVFENNDPDTDSLLTDRTQDSLMESLTSGIGAMPSYLDVQDSARSPSFTPTKGLTDSDTDSDSNKEMHFHSKHFNGSSSSEEENRYSEGLEFSKEASPAPETSYAGLLGQMCKSLVKDAIDRRAPSTAKPLQRTYSSSDSEFEIINENDIGEDEKKSS